MSVLYCQNQEDSSMLYWKRRRCFKWPVGEVKTFLSRPARTHLVRFCPETTCSEAVQHSGRSHLCLWQHCALQHRTLWKKDSKQWTTRHDLQGEGGGALDTVTAPLKWTKYKHTKSDLERGKRGILYMLSYKWCFVRRLLTKTTVSFWCETGSDQNPAKPVGWYYRTP